MSQIRRRIPLLALLLLLVALSLAGCSSPHESSLYDPDGGRHPAGWLPVGHKTAALADLESCAQCHGADFTGGISQVACTNCHIGNQQSVHPPSWGPFAYILHASYVKTNGNISCANASCHGAALTGVGGSGPSCTLCHMGGVSSIHPTSWGNSTATLHGSYAKQNGTTACANAKCHGAGLDGRGGSGPSCTLCHLGGVNSLHPIPWGAYVYALHGSFAKLDGTSACANAVCHGPSLTGVAGSGPSCTLCHMGGVSSIHPSSAWVADLTLHKAYVQTNGDTACRNAVCHGANLEGVYLSGLSCNLCHKYP